jgi:hypothetical protein
MMRACAALVAASLVLGASRVQAQVPVADDRVEFLGSVGVARLSSGDTRWADGAEVGGGITLLPFRGALHKLGVQGSASFLRRDSESLGVATQAVNASQLLMVATWHFSRSHVQPFVLGGVSVLRADRTWTCGGCSFSMDSSTGGLSAQVLSEHVNATEVGLALGGGLRMLIGPRLAARVEANLGDTTPGSGWNWRWSGVRGGLGVRF